MNPDNSRRWQMLAIVAVIVYLLWLLAILVLGTYALVVAGSGARSRQAEALVLCHDPARLQMRGLPERRLPGLAECLAANLQVARLTSPVVRAAGPPPRSRPTAEAATPRPRPPQPGAVAAS